MDILRLTLALTRVGVQLAYLSFAEYEVSRWRACQRVYSGPAGRGAIGKARIVLCFLAQITPVGKAPEKDQDVTYEEVDYNRPCGC